MFKEQIGRDGMECLKKVNRFGLVQAQNLNWGLKREEIKEVERMASCNLKIGIYFPGNEKIFKGLDGEIICSDLV